MTKQTAEMYASLGHELESTADNAWRIAFARAAAAFARAAAALYEDVADGSYTLAEELAPLSVLGMFAQHLGSGVCERLAGRIGVAQLYESYAEAAYHRLPEECQW